MDDLFLTRSSKLIEDCKKNLETEFDMKDLGLMHYFLGLEVWQQDGEIFLSQGWVRSSIDKKSTTGYCFGIGSRVTSWCNKKQKSIALSSVEAEYMAASKATCEVIWLRKLLVNLFKKRMEVTKIFCDNQSCIKLSENPMFHDRSKHIDIQCHFIRDCVQRGAVQLEYTPTGNQVVDVLTKALGRTKFVQFREQMGMLENPFH
eukprot:PITA_06636